MSSSASSLVYALKGAVEIHQVQAGTALRRPLAGHRHRVVGKHGTVFHVALAQTHAMAFLQIDSRYQDHGCPFQFTKLRNNCRPASALFSGWHCSANRLSLAIALVKRIP